MKLLLIGNFEHPTLCASYDRALRRVGALTVLIDIQKEARAARPLGSSLIARLLRGVVVQRVNRAVLDHAGGGSYEAAVVFKGAFLRPETLAALRARLRVPIICLNPDNVVDHRGFWADVLRASVPEYDLYVTYSPTLVNGIQGLQARQVACLPFAWDPDLHPYPHDSAIDVGGHSGIAFVGNWMEKRERFLTALNGLPLRVWGGPRWGRARSDFLRAAWTGESAYGQRFSTIVRAAAVNVNILGAHNEGNVNMRTYEVPGAGGMLLAEDSIEQASLLHPGVHADYFRTPDELRARCEYWLAHVDAARAMARAAHSRIQHETYDLRAHALLALVKRLRDEDDA